MKNPTFKFKKNQMVEVIAGEKRGVKAFIIFGVHREDGDLYKIGVFGEVDYQNERELIKEEDLFLIKDENGNFIEDLRESQHHNYRLGAGDTIKLPGGIIVKAFANEMNCEGCCFNKELDGCDFIPCAFTYKDENLIFKWINK